MKHTIAALVSLLLLAPACTQLAPNDEARRAAAIEDWRDLRFGLFIHWGPVSLAGTEIGWSRGREIPPEEYDALARRWNPVEFDAAEWARLAKEAGMRYVVLVAKHHDGFCLWDSEHTEHDIAQTPFGRDVVGELAAACRAEGLAFGLYYSILDWYQPDYNTAGSQGGPGTSLPEGMEPSMDRYQSYVHAQLTELSARYGPLLTFWFDGEWEKPWTEERGAALLAHCRALSPTMLVNNRVGKAREGMAGTTAQSSANPGDYDTPEQRIGAFEDVRPWETCMTLCRQWAWKPDDEMKSIAECLRTLVRTVGGDGNLLFNVGPMPDGRIEPRQAARLREMGAWLATHGDTIYGTRGGPFWPGDWGASTHRGDEVYVHSFRGEGEELRLPGLDQRIVEARLHDGGAVQWEQTPDLITLRVPAAARDAIDTVVVLRLENEVAGMARWDHLPTPFDLGAHGAWLSEDAPFELSSRAPQWSRHEETLLSAGDPAPDFAFHTEEETDPWITIDLGAVCRVRGMEIENRAGSHQERAAGLTAWTSTDGEAWTEVWRASAVEPRWTPGFAAPGISARWVRLGLHAPEGRFLHLRRLRVYGDR